MSYHLQLTYCSVILNTSRLHASHVQAFEETPESQTAAEEAVWQEYRPEDFGTDDAAGQPRDEKDDEHLRAAIQASKADALAEEARFMSASGGISHDVAAEEVRSDPALNGISQLSASHRAWFPPADTVASKLRPSGRACKGIGQQEASSGTHAEGSENTYDDVMAFLLGS